MQPTGSSKYLQLPAHDSSDFGKPSPLALLAATCQKIGTASRSPDHRTRTPSPVLSSRPDQPIRQPSPILSPAPGRSPVPPMKRETAIPQPGAQPKIPDAATAYELPLTPPSSPKQLDIKASSPRTITTSVSVPTERLTGYITAEHPCHRAPSQPVLHMSSLHHFSPYTMVVPPVIAPYSASGCVNQCCFAHHSAVHTAAVQPILLPAAPIVAAAPLSPPVSFGTYLQHEVESRMSSKLKSRPTTKSTASLYRPYDLARHTRRPLIEDEIIDVVSV